MCGGNAASNGHGTVLGHRRCKTLCGATKRARPSAPGLDGVEYGMWVVAGMANAAVLCDMLCALASGVEPPVGTNDSLAVFLPEGDGEHGGCAWWADALRPLSLRNIDVDLVAALGAQRARAPLRGGVAAIQRGSPAGICRTTWLIWAP